MTPDTLPPVLAGLGIGIALAGAPGPVQAVLLAESVRGGMARGVRALAGASLTFGTMLLALALGVSVLTPEGPALRLLRVAGGVMLLWLAFDATCSGWEATRRAQEKGGIPPVVRGSLAVLLNPGAWLFLGAVASPLLATATRGAGTGHALLTSIALMGGAALGDLGVVILGAGGLRRASPRAGRWIRGALAIVLAALGLWLLVSGLV